MITRAFSRVSSFFRPETPLYVIGISVSALIVFLVFVVLWAAFKPGLPTIQDLFTSFTLKNFSYVFSYPPMPPAALHTVILAIGTTLVAMFFGVPITWLTHRTTIPFKQAFTTIIFLHLILPGFVRIMGWIMLISPEIGIINQAIRSVMPFIEEGPLNPYNLPFMCFLQGIAFTSTFYLMAGGAFMSIDPALEESGQASGMSRIQVFRLISFPLVRPAIVASSIYVFVTAATMYEVPALLGVPVQIHTFSTLLFDTMSPAVGMPKFGVAAVYAILMLIPMLVTLYFYQKMLRRSHRYTTITGKGYRPKLTDLGRWTWAALAFIGIYFIMDIVLPILAVIWTSLLPFIEMPSAAALEKISLGGYIEGIQYIANVGAIGNTLQLVFISGFLSMVIALFISWITIRTKMPGRYALDTISMLPRVVPSLAFAFAVASLGLLLAGTIPLYGSVASIILVDVLERLPFCTRTINSSLIQIHSELEEAVQTSGASKVVALRKIIVPLIVPALLYSFVTSLLHAYRSVTVPLFLMRPGNVVLSTLIWERWTSNEFNVAAAISAIMIVVMAVFIMILLKAFPQIRKGMQR